MINNFDHKALKKWFVSEQRDFPWRHRRDPYSVWVSEMMLQQTQAAVVISYFERWMQRFPTIDDLAKASLDGVIKVWEGLGYYSRARYLHAGAQYLIAEHQGNFPEQPEAMQKIKGLGPYTMGAIRSFAFHHKIPAVDGNVLRVLTRYYMIESDISKPATLKEIHALAVQLLPDEEPWVINEALIELGATMCMRKPNCSQCPLRATCRAYAHGRAEELPYKSKKIQIKPLYRAVAVVRHQNHWLIQRGSAGKIMHDLHEFPYFETEESGMAQEVLQRCLKERFDLKVHYESSLPEIKHSFTRYRVRLSPMQFVCEGKSLPLAPSDYQWVTLPEMVKLAFSSGHRRILGALKGGSTYSLIF